MDCSKWTDIKRKKTHLRVVYVLCPTPPDLVLRRRMSSPGGGCPQQLKLCLACSHSLRTTFFKNIQNGNTMGWKCEHKQCEAQKTNYIEPTCQQHGTVLMRGGVDRGCQTKNGAVLPPFECRMLVTWAQQSCSHLQSYMLAATVCWEDIGGLLCILEIHLQLCEHSKGRP